MDDEPGRQQSDSFNGRQNAESISAIYVHVADGSPIWSPDGTKIVFFSTREGPKNAIWVMNADGSNQRILIDGSLLPSKTAQGSVGASEWSPDGTKLLIVDGHTNVDELKSYADIYTINVDGGNLVQLTKNSRGNLSPSWSPDGRQIVFHSNRDGRYRLYVMNSDGSNQHLLTNPTNIDQYFYELSPAWSPDGRKIVFLGSRDDNGTRDCNIQTCVQIYTVDADGGNEKRLTDEFNLSGYYEYPRWSPDSSKIVFAREFFIENSDGSITDYGKSLIVMNADGSNQVNISNHSFNIYDGQPHWQPLLAPSNEPPPSVLGFSAASYSAYEDSGSIPIIVTRTGNLNDVASVYYATEDGTASVKYNYAPAFGTLRFAAGETSKTISIPLTDNGDVLGNRSFKISLFDNEGNATFLGGTREATVTVLDRDSTPRAKNPIDDARYFVRQHYVDFLNREPDADGLAFWTNEIASCGTDAKCIDMKRQNVSAAFYLSTEFQETGYFFLRAQALGLDRNYGGLFGFWRGLQQLNRGVIVGQPGWQEQLERNKQAFIQQSFDDDRVATSFGFTNEEYVDLLFQYAGLTPTQVERDTLVNGLDVGTLTRPMVLRQVVENERYKASFFRSAFVAMEYVGYLRRGTDTGGYSFWLSKLNQFNGDYIRSEMVRSFILSNEYRTRFGKP